MADIELPLYSFHESQIKVGSVIRRPDGVQGVVLDVCGRYWTDRRLMSLVRYTDQTIEYVTHDSVEHTVVSTP